MEGLLHMGRELEDCIKDEPIGGGELEDCIKDEPIGGGSPTHGEGTRGLHQG